MCVLQARGFALDPGFASLHHDKSLKRGPPGAAWLLPHSDSETQ